MTKTVGNGLLFLYFCGHGRCNNKSEPAVFTVNHKEIRSSDICSWLSDVPCKAKCKLVILECCFSGKIVTSVISQNQSSFTVISNGEETKSIIPNMPCTSFAFFSSLFLRQKHHSLADKDILKLNDIFSSSVECVKVLSSLYIASGDDEDLMGMPMVLKSFDEGR